MFFSCRVGGADVEGHHDVGTKIVLEIDNGFGGEEVFCAVDVGLERDAGIGDFSHF